MVYFIWHATPKALYVRSKQDATSPSFPSKIRVAAEFERAVRNGVIACLWNSTSITSDADMPGRESKENIADTTEIDILRI